MAWGIDALNGPVLTANDVAMFDEMVGVKVHVATLFDLHTLFHFAGAMRSIGVGRRAGFCL